MKSIIERLTSNKQDTGNLSYVMTYESFKKWIKSVDKKDEFVTVALVDTDQNLHDIESSQYAKTYYDETEKNWVAEGESGNLPVDEWTLSNSDIILIWE